VKYVRIGRMLEWEVSVSILGNGAKGGNIAESLDDIDWNDLSKWLSKIFYPHFLHGGNQ